MQCFECGATGELEEHHVIPRSLGGTKTVLLCLKCHMKVHDYNGRKDSHAALIKQGLEDARQKGIVLGRPEGTILPPKDRLEKYSDIVDVLQAGGSVRKTAMDFGVGCSTIQRIKKALTQS